MAIQDSWAAGGSYERFMGRWSRLIAGAFLDWLSPLPHLHWLELGCGTGALSGAILAEASPASLLAIDPSQAFIDFDRRMFRDPHLTFQVGDALSLPPVAHPLDLAVSGLVLNFIQSPAAALQALLRKLQPDGILAFYVWDYAGKMEMLRYFWDSAVALDPAASSLDEGVRFSMCEPQTLKHICRQAGLNQVEVQGIDTSMIFADFSDFWSPFLEGQGPAPGYAMQLDPAARQALEDHLRRALPMQQDGSLHLTARAWAVRATG
jgi:SAM-dependent methyltransferase